MGYSIIFETKIIKMSDGAILHLDRSGCNNDSEGREKGVFVPRLYSPDDFVKRARDYMAGSIPYKRDAGYWDMKIGGRYATYYDYGMHLLRMLKRAVPYADFLTAWNVTVKRYIGIKLIRPEPKVMSFEEFSNAYGLSYQGELRYFVMTENLDSKDEATVSHFIKEGETLEFTLRRAC